jgi:CDP-diacylglycerol---glycerol-3-phosphate 3-phosphatidyltransferase
MPEPGAERPQGVTIFDFNLPNALTVFRILLVPVLVAVLLSEGPSGDLLAAIVFAVASFTDALDGWIARRRKSESTFGKLMDPLADKLLVTSALVSLVSLDRLAAWVAMVIIARELAVTGLRQIAMEQGHVIPASLWGKLKTAAQIAMVMCLIAVDGSSGWVDAVVYVTVAITVLSGADYFFGLRRLLRSRAAPVEPVAHRDVAR